MKKLFTNYSPAFAKAGELLYILMKITAGQILLIALTVSVSFASETYSQELLDREISAKVNGVSLKEALSALEKAAKVKFVYINSSISIDENVSFTASGEKLGVVLDRLLSPLSIRFIVKNKTHIVLKKVKKSSALALPEDGPVNIAPVLLAVSGKVADHANEPMPGVNVLLKGTTKGTTTDAEGKYSIDASENDVLVFSFIGYETEEIPVGNQTVIDVTLTMNIQTLSEVVVTGYGTTNRRDLTGSVSSVSTKEISDAPLVSIDNAIAGKASGVEVIKADGSPGGAVRIKIRGGTSLMGGNEPLYVIDGVPMNITNNYVQGTDMVNPIEINNSGEGTNNYGDGTNNVISGAFTRGVNNLAGININDIESIDILKDASATAIYGSRAANGVVMITTKKGAYDTKPQLDAHVYSGVTHSLRPELLNAEQYKMIAREAIQNYIIAREILAPGRPYQPINAAMEDPNFFPEGDTDWLDLVLRKGLTYSADLSVRGGGKGSRYYTSLSYMKQTGTVIGTDFSRIAGKIRLDNDLSRKVRFSLNLDFGVSVNNLSAGVYAQALIAPPVFEPYQADGSYTSMLLGKDLFMYEGYGFQNPLAVATATNKSVNNLLIGSLSAEYDIVKNLTWKSIVSTTLNMYNQRGYTPSYLVTHAGGWDTQSGQGIGIQANRQTRFMFFENTLTWNKQFNDMHNVNVVAGTSWQTDRMDFFSAEGKQYPNDNSLNNLSSAAIPLRIQGASPAETNSLLSFYARANYTWRDKYLFTFTGRADASSKFARDNQMGYFPSGAVAWRISEENFMKNNVSFVDDLKLRASIGRTGTQNIGSNQWATLYSPVTYGESNATIASQLGNAKIKWEQTLQKDAGLDFSLAKGRVIGTIGYYQKNTEGLLLTLDIAPSAAYETLVRNIANIENKGWEFELKGDVLRIGNFRWNVGVNLTRNRSLVTNIEGGEKSVNLANSIVKEGHPVGVMYGYLAKDIIRTKEQADAYKEKYIFWKYFDWRLAVDDGIGTMEFELDSANYNLPKEDVIGYAAPDFYGGFTHIFSYKNLNLSLGFTYSKGNEILYMSDLENSQVTNLANKTTRILGRWTPENPNADRPKLVYPGAGMISNKQVYDASYIKLRTLSLSYDLSNIIKTRAASIYFSGLNLFTITNYPGLDPEVSDDPYSLIGGSRDVDSYPSNRSYTIGVRIGL